MRCARAVESKGGSMREAISPKMLQIKLESPAVST